MPGDTAHMTTLAIDEFAALTAQIEPITGPNPRPRNSPAHRGDLRKLRPNLHRRIHSGDAMPLINNDK